MKRVAIASALGVALFALAGCAGKSSVADRIPGRVLTIYSSLPLRGASDVSAEAVVNGERLALARVQGRIGRYRVRLRSLDDSSLQRAEWDPGQTTLNARLAAHDPSAVGYIGDLDSGASAVSIPDLNRAGIAQISPGSTAVGLTSAGAGASPGEPQKYYPTGVRTFARVIPNDAVQALVQVRLQRSLGCTKTYVLDDGEVDGQDTAASFGLAAAAAGLTLAGAQTYDPRASDYSSLIAGVSQTGADCVLISALAENNAVLLATQVGELMPSATIFAPTTLAESTFTQPARGGLPAKLDPRVIVTAAALSIAAYPAAGRAFLSGYQQAYGHPEPSAIFGYEAMSLMLDALSRATDGGRRPARRSAVVAAVFATRRRSSVLGTYSIDGDGDTTLSHYGAYQIRHGQLWFWKAVEG